MNAITAPLLWGIGQVTVVALVAVFLYLLAARSDAAVNVIAQAAWVVQFYHPLSHWLLRRLRLEQEFAADAEAATISGGRERYLRSLAGLALARDPMRLAWPAGAFIPTRHTLMKRIEMLRGTDSLRERFPRFTRHVAIVTLALCGVAVSGFRPVPADAPRDPQSPQAAAPPTASPNDTTESETRQHLPDVLAYVPGDAELVGKVKVAKLLDSPQFAPLKQVIEQMGANAESGIPFDQIEDIAVFVREMVPGKSLRPYHVIRYRDAVSDFGPAAEDKVILREKRTLVMAGFPTPRGGSSDRTLTVDDLKPEVLKTFFTLDAGEVVQSYDRPLNEKR